MRTTKFITGVRSKIIELQVSQRERLKREDEKLRERLKRDDEKLRARLKREDEKLRERLKREGEEYQKQFVTGRGVLKNVSQSGYAIKIKATVKKLYRKKISKIEFVINMSEVLKTAYQTAWGRGESECGIRKDERTPQENQILRGMIYEDTNRLIAYSDSIVQNRLDDKSINKSLSRSEIWINRYRAVKERAKVEACGNRKLEWVLGQAEHCEDCMSLSGKVKRALFWSRSGIYPQHRRLACGGFRCKCSLIVTRKLLSPGKLPSIW